MSMAKKCDICEEFYEGYAGISGISLERMHMFESGIGRTENTMDCCPKCMSEILKTIERLGEKNG